MKKSNIQDFVPEWYQKPVLIIGCGNILIGDDGFGPSVIEYLQKNFNVPDHVSVVDAGTGIREILFDIILGEYKPKKIIIVDSIDMGGKPGQVFKTTLENFPFEKVDDFSLHQIPTSNLLIELQDFCNIEIILIVAQVESIPKTVRTGLSDLLINSIPQACHLIMQNL